MDVDPRDDTNRTNRLASLAYWISHLIIRDYKHGLSVTLLLIATTNQMTKNVSLSKLFSHGTV